MRRFVFGVILSAGLGVLLAGCFLLSPDARDDEFALRIVVRSEGEARAKGPCVRDPFALLVQAPEEEFQARAVLRRRSSCEADELAEEVARIPLQVGEVVDGARELTGVFEFDLGPRGSCYSVDVELRHLGAERIRDLSGEWRGQIVLEGEVVVEVASLQLGLDGIVGPISSFGGTILLAHPSIDPQDVAPVGVSVSHDATDARVLGSYLTAPVDFFDDGELRRIEVAMEAKVQPATIFATYGFELGELQPGAETNAAAEIVLDPVTAPVLQGGVLIDTEILGKVAVRFENGDPDRPRALGTVELHRFEEDPSCD